MIREFKETPFELNHQEIILDGEFFRVYPDMPGLHVMDTYYFVPKINTAEVIQTKH